jgi:hypothetical protein
MLPAQGAVCGRTIQLSSGGRAKSQSTPRNQDRGRRLLQRLVRRSDLSAHGKFAILQAALPRLLPARESKTLATSDANLGLQRRASIVWTAIERSISWLTIGMIMLRTMHHFMNERLGDLIISLGKQHTEVDVDSATCIWPSSRN